MPEISIDVPEHTWVQVVELAAKNWRSARDEVSLLVVTSAAEAVGIRAQEVPDRQLVTVGAQEGA